MFCFFVVFCFCAGVEAIDCTLEPKNDEGRLRKTLLCGYDKDNRPTTADGPILVKFKMIVKGFNFEDVESKMTVSTWLAMVCKMCMLKVKVLN